ncbi:MAG: 30S ribosome-binding factor RbfA [Phycisphaeraceae bacterium]
MSRRREQFTSTLTRALSTVLTTRLNDPRIAGMITVTKMEVSPDFRHAVVGISVMPEKHESRTLHGLKHAARHIQALLYKEVRTRTIPHLHFELDRSLKKQADMLDLIRKAVESSEPAPGSDDVDAADALPPSDTNSAPEDPPS